MSSKELSTPSPPTNQHDADTGVSVMDLRPITAPRLTGTTLTLFAKFTRFPGLGNALLKKIKKDNDFQHVRYFAGTLATTPLYYPLRPPSPAQLDEHDALASDFSISRLAATIPPEARGPFHHWTIQNFTDRYRAGTMTPLQAITAVLDAIDASNARSPPLMAIIKCNRDAVLQAAEASAARYANNAPLGVLDGVPIAVKDELDVIGYTTSYGTTFLGDVRGIASADAVPVARLRRLGAIVVGKTNMHEVGLGTFGINVRLGTARNPYNDEHMTGGSSSGSAAAVTAGLVPLAIGCDGGGSIRIPSGLCGIVGLKATFMRIPHLVQACPSVGHVGPMAATVQDAALAYAIMSGPEPDLLMSQCQPPPFVLPYPPKVPSSRGLLGGLRVGIYTDYLDGVDTAIASVFWEYVAYLKHVGATVVQVAIPHLQAIHLSHAITILTELSQHLDDQPVQRFSPDVQINLGLARQTIDSLDFVAAQKVRAYAIELVHGLFDQVDVLFTPTTATLAPHIHPDALKSGLSDLDLTTALMRFVVLGNLVGIPGMSLPLGFDDASGLPISMQFQAKHWNEHLLIHVARILEAHAPTKQPSVYYSVLS
ncbi:Aste57867_20935 [Aphanomyces stellatus]|uniref:Aste57867_20935 protein n=1 Tax=Aphanomyces stellatus TaxID=120398 RepID=A0A485LI92_9STRA|nr:hypothetical protein As57867_020867 [Aphanomyces stellatus]VFT97612.1 Aste57867_20935 [Aphanomyces stellatus]